jgi:hypothetical protein
MRPQALEYADESDREFRHRQTKEEALKRLELRKGRGYTRVFSIRLSNKMGYTEREFVRL